jgi:hypothetical protein
MASFDAVPVPMKGPEFAVRLLLDRFPSMGHLFDDTDYFETQDPEPHRYYERFAEEVLRRQHEQEFMASAYTFINELALSHEYWIEEVLNVSLLEHLAQDPAFAARAYDYLNAEAQSLLRTIEKQMYGRHQS